MRIRFGSMVVLLLQLAVASIPAAIVLAFTGAVLAVVFGELMALLDAAAQFGEPPAVGPSRR